MDSFETIILIFDSLIDTERKRHITGGALLSLSLLFAGLAITVITSKYKEANTDD